MDETRKHVEDSDPAPFEHSERLAWGGISGRRETADDADSNAQEGIGEATRAELREAAAKSFDQPGGERGDLGDSGPGED